MTSPVLAAQPSSSLLDETLGALLLGAFFATMYVPLSCSFLNIVRLQLGFTEFYVNNVILSSKSLLMKAAFSSIQ